MMAESWCLRDGMGYDGRVPMIIYVMLICTLDRDDGGSTIVLRALLVCIIFMIEYVVYLKTH